ncbi:DUF2255 family protein [Companilactobacillus jidongensis]|uniref:DUF2255 family protein n=1 Tax=Companilactobacillus jidongensis TaxID=2486006 RepID=UPI000F779126|nr:DUF2255 family protein [Companilactobacillus jidongensis]
MVVEYKKSWDQDQLLRFASADDMRVSPFYSDGKTYGTPTWIWSVVVDDQLYIRAWNGTNSRWYRSAVEQKAGRIHLAGSNFKVNFEVVSDNDLNELVDDEYKIKYSDSSYLLPMLQENPRNSTLRIIPR